MVETQKLKNSKHEKFVPIKSEEDFDIMVIESQEDKYQSDCQEAIRISLDQIPADEESLKTEELRTESIISDFLLVHENQDETPREAELDQEDEDVEG